MSEAAALTFTGESGLARCNATLRATLVEQRVDTGAGGYLLARIRQVAAAGIDPVNVQVSPVGWIRSARPARTTGGSAAEGQVCLPDARRADLREWLVLVGEVSPGIPSRGPG